MTKKEQQDLCRLLAYIIDHCEGRGQYVCAACRHCDEGTCSVLGWTRDALKIADAAWTEDE